MCEHQRSLEIDFVSLTLLKLRVDASGHRVVCTLLCMLPLAPLWCSAARRVAFAWTTWHQVTLQV